MQDLKVENGGRSVVMESIIQFARNLFHCQLRPKQLPHLQARVAKINFERKSTYESLSDVGESRVWFASKNLTPFLIAKIIAKCHSFPNMYDMLKAKVDRLAGKMGLEKKTASYSGQKLASPNFGRTWRPKCCHQVNFLVTLDKFGFSKFEGF